MVSPQTSQASKLSPGRLDMVIYANWLTVLLQCNIKTAHASAADCNANVGHGGFSPLPFYLTVLL